MCVDVDVFIHEVTYKKIGWNGATKNKVYFLICT